MSLYGPTFHATPIDLCIKFQCNIYIVSCLVEINLYRNVITLNRVTGNPRESLKLIFEIEEEPEGSTYEDLEARFASPTNYTV